MERWRVASRSSDRSWNGAGGLCRRIVFVGGVVVLVHVHLDLSRDYPRDETGGVDYLMYEQRSRRGAKLSKHTDWDPWPIN